MNHNMQLQSLLEKLQQRVKAVPDDMNAVADLAAVLAQSGQAQQALSLLLPALQQHPHHPGLQHNLAELYRNAGEMVKAEQLFTALIIQQPYFLPAYQSLMLILNNHLATAQLTDEQRTNILVQLARLSSNKGNVLLAAGQAEAAEAAYSEALKYWSNYSGAHANLANLFCQQGQVSKAEVYARAALSLQPDFAEAWNNLGMALSEQGRIPEAVNCYQRALAVNPALFEARHNAGSGSLFLYLYRDDLTAKQVVDAHRQWGEVFKFTAAPHATPSGDKLRVGFISADFREHPVAYFAEALFENLDREQFEIICYANQTIEDAFTQRIKTLPLLWREVATLSDDALCEQIRQDQLHILIDLSGHMKGHRLYALAKKPAPIIAHWMGYLFTVGLPASDYYIADRWIVPEAVAEQQFIEKLAYLPNSLFNYRPKANVPEVNVLPALHKGFITFGSLNNLQKMNRHVVSAWSQILLSIPNSRLILQTKLLADLGVVGRIRGLFEAFGVDAQRLDLRPASVHCFHTYHEIDIALDTFPYTGATTTCEALWMGVPVLSLVGDSSISRQGVSILSVTGMESWLANSIPGYIALAQQHSASLETLAALRANLRTQVANSSLCDDKTFAVDFARCLKKMVADKN